MGGPVEPPPRVSAQVAGGCSSLLRRVQRFAQIGVLTSLDERINRRGECATCDQRRALKTHPGLFGCSACSACDGLPERMLWEGSVCRRGIWGRRKAR